MAKKKESLIEQIERKLHAHVQEMEALFPMEMNISVIGRDPNGMGCEFVIGRDSPTEMVGVIERAVERIAEAEAKAKKTKKAAPKAKKKVKKA